MTQAQGCLVITLQADLTDEAFGGVHRAVTERLVESQLDAAIFDFSGVQILDAYEFDRFARLARVAGLLGARVVLVGLTPGIAAFLAHADVDTEGMRFCLQMEDAFALLARRQT
ncbi:hypothetical protein RD110_18495 [Rhodoferax koreense]|uniref:STAS domain-containing protein n=2 Tax=Rhodoferax koreensis TaxID=1842727 RepID=A0A1P8JYW3_9BURK|nr:hypothetical protein RD110_18495 [Rhodoferax koreense]